MTLEGVYRSALYLASLPGGEHRITVDAPSPALDRLMAECRVASAARLSAANPGSVEERPADLNAAANARLAADLDRVGARHFPCRSEGPEGEWPEEGFLALGLTRAQAELLARVHGQAGYLWIEPGRHVALVML